MAEEQISSAIMFADEPSQKGLHDMYMMMRFMDHALCVALEGADLQMLGQMGCPKDWTLSCLPLIIYRRA